MASEMGPQLQALVRWVASEHVNGSTDEEIIDKLSSQGMHRADAAALVGRVRTAISTRRSVGSRVRGYAAGWIGLGVAFLLLNGMLWLGQEVYHRADVEQAEQLERELAAVGLQIDEMDAWLDAKLAESNAIDELGASLEDPRQFSTEAQYQAALKRYNSEVSSWNVGLDEMTRISTARESAVAEYNSKVDTYNQVAKNAYSRWYLLPIPSGRRAQTHRAVN